MLIPLLGKALHLTNYSHMQSLKINLMMVYQRDTHEKLENKEMLMKVLDNEMKVQNNKIQVFNNMLDMVCNSQKVLKLLLLQIQRQSQKYIDHWVCSSNRLRKQVYRYDPSQHYVMLSDEGELCTKWDLAMQEEIKSLYANDTWDLVSLHEGRKVILNKWVYNIKTIEGKPKCKARLVFFFNRIILFINY